MKQKSVSRNHRACSVGNPSVMMALSWQEACRQDTSLLSLDAFFPTQPHSVQPLAGGLTNRCWKITLTPEQSYVWRPATSLTQAFAISRPKEHHILCVLQDTGLAPQAITLNDHGLLVEWIDGEALHQGVSTSVLAHQLAMVHQCDTQNLAIPVFDFSHYVHHYWQQIDDKYKTSKLIEHYHRWRFPPQLTSIDPTLCHCDLGGYNLIQTETGVRIIDWEYAIFADPRLDLALALGAADLPMIDMVQAYCTQRGIKEETLWLEGVQAWLPRTQMVAILWYLLAYQWWGDDHYYHTAQQIAEEL